MKKTGLILLVLSLVVIASITVILQVPLLRNEDKDATMELIKQDLINLPEPVFEGETSLEETILKRRSVRSYRDEALSLKEISQVLWAAQGVTGGGFKRAAPSAGATYPLEIYVVVKKLEDVEPGVYHYIVEKHSLEKTLSGDYSRELRYASWDQSSVGEAPVNLVFCAVYERTTQKYGERGIRYVHMEVGHAAQNVYLQCQSLGLGTVVVGAFNDPEVKKILNLTKEEPLYVMPVGRI